MRHMGKADIVYSGFLLGGIVSLIMVLVSYLPLSNGQSGVLGFVVLIPISIIGLLVIPACIVCTFVFHLDWQLKVLAGFSAIFVIELFWEVGPAWFYNTLGVIYGLVATYLPIRWFYGKAITR